MRNEAERLTALRVQQVGQQWKKLSSSEWESIASNLAACENDVSYIFKDEADHNRIKVFDRSGDPIDGLTDRTITKLFRSGTVEAIDLQGNGVVAFVFGCDGNVAFGVDHGIFYSPDDLPLCINVMDESGALFNVPMVEYGNGYIADVKAAREILPGDYTCYAERIADKWFYFEAGY